MGGPIWEVWVPIHFASQHRRIIIPPVRSSSSPPAHSIARTIGPARPAPLAAGAAHHHGICLFGNPPLQLTDNNSKKDVLLIPFLVCNFFIQASGFYCPLPILILFFFFLSVFFFYWLRTVVDPGPNGGIFYYFRPIVRRGGTARRPQCKNLYLCVSGQPWTCHGPLQGEM